MPMTSAHSAYHASEFQESTMRTAMITPGAAGAHPMQAHSPAVNAPAGCVMMKPRQGTRVWRAGSAGTEHEKEAGHAAAHAGGAGACARARAGGVRGRGRPLSRRGIARRGVAARLPDFPDQLGLATRGQAAAAG